MIFSDNSVSLISKAYNYISQHSVIHIYTSFMNDRSCIYSKCISLLNMIVKHCGQKIICRGYSMKISCKVKI